MKTHSILGIAATLFTPSLTATPTSSSPSSTGVLKNKPSTEPVIGQVTHQGCFNSSLGLELINENLKFNTDGSCSKLCVGKDYPVGATSGGQACWCGHEYPPENTLVDDSECNIGCTGFNTIACGGLDTWSVYNTGLKLAVHFHDPDTSSSTTGSDAPAQTSAGSSQPSSAGNESDGGDNSKTVGIAVGVVAGLVILGAAVGGLFWYLKKKRNQEIEEEHRRNAAVSAFINGSNAPDSSHGSISMTDSRLDPVMAQRRLSDGSIADNQDYSRKILRVTNA